MKRLCAVMALLVSASFADAALRDAVITGDSVSFFSSIATWQACSDGSQDATARNKACWRAVIDPEFVHAATVYVEVRPADRVGPVISLNYLNGYVPVDGDPVGIPPLIIGAGDTATAVFRIPVVTTLDSAPEDFDGRIAEIEFLDLGSPNINEPIAEPVVFGFRGEDIFINPDNGEEIFQVEDSGPFELDGASRVWALIMNPEEVVPAAPLAALVDPGRQAADGVGPLGPTAVELNENTNQLSVVGSYLGLTEEFRSVGIYGPATFGTIGPSIKLLEESRTIDDGEFQLSATLTEQEVDWLIGGQMYVQLNVDDGSGGFAGEIRAQIVPEPSSLVLTLVCTGLMMATRRRRRSLAAAA